MDNIEDLVILDGGLATELERRGADLNDPLWSARLLLENPDLIRRVHLDYFRAGACVAISASYQASFAGFAARGLDAAQAAALMRRSVELAREARTQYLAETGPRGPQVWVAASIGCYGATLHDGSEYRGDYGLSLRQLIDWHRPRLETLLAAGPDFLACETIPSLIEGCALARLLEEYAGARAWLSFSCRDGLHLRHGELFTQAVALANDAAKVFAVGVNCTAPWHVESLLSASNGIARKPLLAYPNSGEGWDAQRHVWLPGEQSFSWQEAVPRWIDAGARWIGGCCRTTPETIRLVAAIAGERNLDSNIAAGDAGSL